ncbi:RBBP9/YdeN family alpha/beta hydrolase [Nakamurella sp.]|uniref:RBBP9/YdeN family alpha/beta hydrolase n=1 Tax=Nakamurella sp. TaxID=1869182 RepID=UPI003B3B762F
MRFVIVPGIDGSDEDHWQSAWERELGPAAVRIEPSSWSEPDPADWSAALDRCVPADGPSLLIAHSLGCHAVAHWSARPGWSDPGVLGAVLVAPPDPAGPAFPAAAAGFATLPAAPLPYPGLVVASDDDPYATPAATADLAAGWGVPVVSMGRAGHLNSASRLGRWPAGQALVTAFRAGLRGRPRPPAPGP